VSAEDFTFHKFIGRECVAQHIIVKPSGDSGIATKTSPGEDADVLNAGSSRQILIQITNRNTVYDHVLSGTRRTN